MVRMTSIASLRRKVSLRFGLTDATGISVSPKVSFSPSPPLYSGQPACWLSLPLSSFVLAAVAATGTISVFLSRQPPSDEFRSRLTFFRLPSCFFLWLTFFVSRVRSKVAFESLKPRKPFRGSAAIINSDCCSFSPCALS